MTKTIQTIVLICLSQLGLSQTTSLNLKEAIDIAFSSSLQSEQVRNNREIADLDFKVYKSGFLPSLVFNGTLPSLNRSLESVTQPDGTDIFVSRSLATSSARLFLAQDIGITGGRILIQSSLDRIDIFGDNPSTAYLSTPLNVQLIQPIFGFNSVKWERMKEPKRYDYNRLLNVEQREDIRINTTSLFYDVLIDQIQADIAESNKTTQDTIYMISNGRYEMGKIAENDLLQAEIIAINSQVQLEQAKLNLDISTRTLKDHLRIPEETNLILEFDGEVPPILMDEEKAIELAVANQSSVINRELRKIEAEQSVAVAKANRRPQVNIQASYGLSSSSSDYSTVYSNPTDQQTFLLGLNVPIFDFGKSRAAAESAILEARNSQLQLELDDLTFRRQVVRQVKNFRFLQEQLEIAQRKDVLADKGFEVSYHRFMIGKTSLTDYDRALQEKISSKGEYLNALQRFWEGYYEIRKLTHYDWIKGQVLEP
jgi:outer membrane protein TolC